MRETRNTGYGMPVQEREYCSIENKPCPNKPESETVQKVNESVNLTVQK